MTDYIRIHPNAWTTHAGDLQSDWLGALTLTACCTHGLGYGNAMFALYINPAALYANLKTSSLTFSLMPFLLSVRCTLLHLSRTQDTFIPAEGRCSVELKIRTTSTSRSNSWRVPSGLLTLIIFLDWSFIEKSYKITIITLRLELNAQFRHKSLNRKIMCLSENVKKLFFLKSRWQKPAGDVVLCYVLFF